MTHVASSFEPGKDQSPPDPGHRLLMDTFLALVEEQELHDPVPSLRPEEIERAMRGFPAPMIGARETLAMMMGYPRAQPGAIDPTTTDPARVKATAAKGPAQADEPLVERVERGNGEWSYRRFDGAAVGERRWFGPMLYEFRGQRVHSDWRGVKDPTQWIAKTHHTESRAISPLGAGSLRSDSEGGVWVAVASDQSAIADRVREYDALIRRTMGVDEPVGESNEGMTEEIGGLYERHKPEACDGVKYHFWGRDGDDRERWSGLLTERQKAAAVLFHSPLGWLADGQVKGGDGGALGLCGAVFIGQDALLTAAHCVGDDPADGAYRSDTLRVCSQGNAASFGRCSNVDHVVVNPEFTRLNKARADIAVVFLKDPSPEFTDSHTSMGMSRASDSFVTDFKHHNVAYPRHAPPENTCSDNSAPYQDYLMMQEAYHAVLDRAKLTAPWYVGSLLFKHAGGEGHSGSPIFYCGDERCDTGDGAIVVSIWSGYRSAYRAHIGPKVREYRAWVLGAM